MWFLVLFGTHTNIYLWMLSLRSAFCLSDGIYMCVSYLSGCTDHFCSSIFPSFSFSLSYLSVCLYQWIKYLTATLPIYISVTLYVHTVLLSICTLLYQLAFLVCMFFFTGSSVVFQQKPWKCTRNKKCFVAYLG